MTGDVELTGDSLLARRPHFRRSGNELIWLGSEQPHRHLSDVEALLWDFIESPKPLSVIREKLGIEADPITKDLLRLDLCDLLEPSFPENRRRVLVIEPHADDAVLSVGGTMWMHRHDTEFIVATMASRSNHTRYRDLGRDLFDVSEATRIRNLESRLYARLLGGAHVEVGLTDSELRYRDSNWTASFFQRHRMSIRVSASRIAGTRERALWTEAIQRLLAEYRTAEVWIPLGGPHTDHLLTTDACFAAFVASPQLVQGRKLSAYGEFPYMARYPRKMQESLDSLRKAGVELEETLVPIGPVLAQKERLAAVYDSQDIKGMLQDMESSARAQGTGTDRYENFWEIKQLPGSVNPKGVLSAAAINPALASGTAAWASRNRGAKSLRVLLLMPTGQWASDLKLLLAAFPNAKLEVHVATTAAAEVLDVNSDRVDLHMVSGGTLPWIVRGLGISLSMNAKPTLFHVGERRKWQARLLSKMWPGSDTLIVESMNQLVNALGIST